MDKNYYELVEWETKHGDDNDGFIYGIHYLDEEYQIMDVEWFRTEGKRILAISELLEDGYIRIY